MFVTLVTVQSLDGKMTRGDDPDVHAWSSDEDFRNFASLRDAHDVIVMGRTTYEVIRPTLHLRQDKLRIVLTAHPERFADQVVPGALEFTNEQPAELVARLESSGHKKLLLTTGGQGNAAFLQAGLVNELYATIEPHLFGQGAELAGNVPMDVRLKLQAVRQLNDHGTILLHYQVAQPLLRVG